MIGKSSSLQLCCWVKGCQRCWRSRSASSAADIGIVDSKLAPDADEPPRVSRVPARRIEVLAAVVGAASLGAEIAAARLLAPWFGASTIVWANTIATVLVALSAGYWVGGRLADRDPTLAGLSRVVLCAAVLLALVPFVAGPFLRISVQALDRVQAGAFVGSLLRRARARRRAGDAAGRRRALRGAPERAHGGGGGARRRAPVRDLDPRLAGGHLPQRARPHPARRHAAHLPGLRAGAGARGRPGAAAALRPGAGRAWRCCWPSPSAPSRRPATRA